MTLFLVNYSELNRDKPITFTEIQDSERNISGLFRHPELLARLVTGQ